MEEWKQCGESKFMTYFISNQGNVKSIRKSNKVEFFLKLWPNTKGYMCIDINKETHPVHRLVALYFIGSRPNGLQIDHINRNKLDNNVQNLRYCDQYVNMKNSNRYRTDIDEEDSQKRKNIINKQSKIRNKGKYDYSEKRKTKYTCECGSTLCKNDKARHERSIKHQSFLKK